jgi:hypothetical protein
MSELETTQSDTPDPFGIPDPIVGSDHEKIVQSVKELNEQRREHGTPFGRDEIKERTWHLSGPTTLKDATSKISDEHKIERAQEYMRSIGVKADDDYALQVGHEAARLGRQPSELPISKVAVINDHGQAVPELRDDEPITQQNSFDSPAEARRAMANYRAAQSATAEALLAELGAAQQEEAMAASRAERGEEREEQPAQIAPPSAPPRPQPQRVDPVAVERAQLQQERQAVEQFRTLTVQEARHALEIQNGIEFYRANQFPPLNDQNAINQMAAHDPQRFQLWRETLEALQGHQNQLATLQAQKLPYIQRQESLANAQRERAFSHHDEVFNTWLKQSYPNYASGARRAELSQAVKSYLRDDLKMSDQQINHHYRVTGVLRDSAAQRLLADAALFKLAQANAKNIAEKRVHAPPSQRPGVVRPRGADAEDSVRSLEKQLETASGMAALKLATRLTQAKRGAGHL